MLSPDLTADCYRELMRNHPQQLGDLTLIHGVDVEKLPDHQPATAPQCHRRHQGTHHWRALRHRSGQPAARAPDHGGLS